MNGARARGAGSADEVPRVAAREAVPPAAVRLRRPSWRDPRLVAGVGLVAGSVLLGSVVMARADDTVPVWAVRTDLPAGATVRENQLVATDVRFAGSDEADRYLPATAPLPEGLRLARAVGRGELLPRAAVEAGAAPALVEVPLAVPAEAVPTTVRPGTVVDVWVTPESPDGEAVRSELVLDDVLVVAAPRGGSALGPSTTRQVVVGVPEAERDVLPVALARVATGTLVLTRQG